MVATIRHTAKGITATMKGRPSEMSVYMAELLVLLAPALENVKPRRYTPTGRKRFYLRLSLIESKDGSSINLTIKDTDGTEVTHVKSHRKFKDVHGIANLVVKALKKNLWLVGCNG